jgi:ADP-ribose pyrophosphatase YjhB (NUDIX family)
MQFKIIVRGIIVDGDKVLLVKKVGEKEWTLPSGFLEYGEKLKLAVMREVKEETGLDVFVGKVNSAFTFVGKEDNVQIVGLSYLCKYQGGDVKLNEELCEYKWVYLKSIEQYDITKGVKKELDRVLKKRKSLT